MTTLSKIFYFIDHWAFLKFMVKESQDTFALCPWQRAKGKGQRAKGKGQKAKGKGQRAKGKGQRSKGKTTQIQLMQFHIYRINHL